MISLLKLLITNPTYDVRSVDKIINHENFMLTLYENDISLLRTDKPFTYTPRYV